MKGCRLLNHTNSGTHKLTTALLCAQVHSMAYPEGYPMIHPTLQDRDFELLNEGDPVFMDLDGGCKLFQREF